MVVTVSEIEPPLTILNQSHILEEKPSDQNLLGKEKDNWESTEFAFCLVNNINRDGSRNLLPPKKFN